MSPAALTLALGGRWHGRGGMASCPVVGHGRGLGDEHPSLSISAGARQSIVVYCHAGCSQADVICALKALGLWERPAIANRPVIEISRRTAAGPDRRIQLASRIWSKSIDPKGTLAETYLAGRGLSTDSPALRFLPHAAWTDIPATADGALVAALSSRSGQVHAVQLTYLTDKGQKAKASPVRQTFGPMTGTAVQLTCCDDTLGLAEGVETALSASLLHKVPVWAACGRRLKDVPIPSSVRNIILFADNDLPGCEAAESALKVFDAYSLNVTVCTPTTPGQDWNDALLNPWKAH